MMKQRLAWIVRTRPFLAAVLALLLSTSLNATTVSAPKVMAVLMYADWCASCKILDPKVQAVRPEFEQSDILFLRFDFTDEATTFQSGMLAQALGLDQLYGRTGGRTGYMVLVDPTTGEVTAMIRAGNSEAEIQQMLRAALGHPDAGTDARRMPGNPSTPHTNTRTPNARSLQPEGHIHVGRITSLASADHFCSGSGVTKPA